MDSVVRISFSAVTHIGSAVTANDDRIFTDGRFTSYRDTDSLQVSLEDSGRQFLFALCDGMDLEESGISTVHELKKFQQKAKSSIKDIQVKVDELVDCVEQSSNLLYSVSLGENGLRGRKTAFAGLLVDNGKAAAVSMGTGKIYMLDGGNLRLLVDDFKRAERLLKMGIINDEQAEMLTGRRKAYDADGKPPVKKTDVFPLKGGAVYLLCSSGLVDSVSEDAIYDILSSGGETDEMAERLIDEALKNDSEDNVTAAVLKIHSDGSEEEEETQGTAAREGQARTMRPRSSRYARLSRKSSLDAAKLVSTIIVVIVIAAVIFGLFTLWVKMRNPGADNAAAARSSLASTEASSTQGLVAEGGDTAATDESGDGTISTASTEGPAETVKAGDKANTAVSGNTGGTADTGGSGKSGSTSKSGSTGKAGSTGNAGSAGNTGGAGKTGSSGSSSNAGNTGKSGSNTVQPVKEGTTYTVRAGDNLMQISVKFYGVEAKYTLIMQANDITNADKIQVGQVLKIPPLK